MRNKMLSGNFGGVDNKCKKRALLTALLLGALFCWGNEVSAYTYSGQNITIDSPNEDENELIVTGNSQIISSNNINVQKIKVTTYDKAPNDDYSSLIDQKVAVLERCGYQETDSEGNPVGEPQKKEYNIVYKVRNDYSMQLWAGTNVGIVNGIFMPGNKEKIHFNVITKDYETVEQGKAELEKYYNDDWYKYWDKYGIDMDYEIAIEDPELLKNATNQNIETLFSQKYPNLYKLMQNEYSKNPDDINNIQVYMLPTTNLLTSKTNLGDANITITGTSSLTGKAGVQTTKAINVNTNSKLTAAGAIDAGSMTVDASIITGASITSNQKLSATNGGSISAINGNLTANHITVATGSTVSATGTITTTGISANNGKIKAGNLTANNLSIWNGSMVDISNGTLTVNSNGGWLDAHSGKIKAKFLKVKNTTGRTNSIGSNTYITGGLTLKGKAQTVSAGATNTDLINKVQMTTALNNAKPKLGKTYSAGTGINLSTNNAVGLTNAAAYTTSDKKRISLVGAAKTYVNKVKTGKVLATSKDLINGSQLYAVQQSIAGFADHIQTNKKQLEALRSSIDAKKAELSGIQKNLNTIKENKLSQDMSNLTTDGEAVIKSQVKKAIQKFQKDMDVSTVQANVQEAKVTTTANTLSSKNNEPSIMLADAPIETTNEPVNAVSAISKEDVAAKADLSQTKVSLEKKATLDTMDVSAYTKQLSKGLATGESAYHALQEAKEDRLVQAKENTLTVGANGAETKIDASKKNWTGIVVDKKEAGSMANVGYVDQTLSMESSYDRLSLMRKDLEKDTNKGIAKAAAMAALKPIGHDEEDKVSFAIGYGHYKDGNAAAIGTFYRPNQDVLIHLDITAGAGKPGMNTGVSFKVGKGSSYASMTREQLAEENAAMRDQTEKQAERIHTQKEKIEHLESVMQSIRF